MLTREFLNIPIKVLRADLVESPFVRPFQSGPERFDTVGMSHTLDELPDTMVYGFMIGKPTVTLMVVGIDLSVRGSVVSYKILYCFLFPVGNSLGNNSIGFPVLYSNYYGFAGRALHMASLIVMLVSILTAHKGFVSFNRALKIVVSFGLPCFPYPVKHEPRRGLGYPYISVKFHAGHAFKACKAKVDSQRPLLKGDVRTGNSGSGTDAEITPAILAPVGHGFGVRNFPCFHASALGAKTGIAPDNGFEPASGRFFVRKHFHKFKKIYSLPVSLTGSFKCFLFHHGNNIHKEIYFVK